ncbi:MAG: hypothetical protein ACLFNO_00135 [Parcubacteria group bacterium]
MVTETDIQRANTVSKRAQLNKDKRESRGGSRVPEGQIAGGGANLAFDNGLNNREKQEDSFKGKNSDKTQGAKSLSGNDGSNYRQVMAQEKKKQEKSTSKRNKKSPTYQGSKRALAMAWEALIPSWFTSIIVIDILAFLHVVFPKHFCSLGEEWESPMAAMAGDKKGFSAKSSMMKTVEPMLVIFINLIILVIIAVILGVISLVVGAIADPIGFLSSLMGSWWEYIKNAFGA